MYKLIGCLLMFMLAGCATSPALEKASAGANSAAIDDNLEAVEKKHILRILESERGNKSASARRLGISRKTLDRKIRRWSEET